ncbi:hypothetical protein [Methanosarcina mazei]|uniref:Uncharacterized protein n=1 Tax=Methanosarcina mazei TaxID=2209 RepID=A0A0F8JVZ3_METMZ|nr:hypothetical protein [Methanosarcina mazei]KKG79803.1 hypothetical protein DU55_13080 [Methanosarcina mazei]
MEVHLNEEENRVLKHYMDEGFSQCIAFALIFEECKNCNNLKYESEISYPVKSERVNDAVRKLQENSKNSNEKKKTNQKGNSNLSKNVKSSANSKKPIEKTVSSQPTK